MISINQVMKALGIVAVSAGVLVGGVFLGTEDEPSAAQAVMSPTRYYQEGEIPTYPGSLEYALGDDLNVNGVRTRISYFYTGDSPDKVIDFYVKKLTKSGLSPKVARRSATETNVYALNALQSNQISVTVVADGGRTVVFPSIIPMSGKILSGAGVKSDRNIPFSPHAVGIMNVSSGNETGGFVTYLEPKMDVISALGYIRDDFGRRNWSIQDYRQNVDGNGNVAYIQVKKGAAHMAFNISKVAGHSGVTITVNTIRSGD